MTTIFQTYINAILADATYALDTAVQGDLTGATSKRLTGYLTPRMTPTLAQYIGDNFTVITHKETSDILNSGFDATVWKENSTGKLTISMQGTTGLQDFLTDVDLAITGNARNQIVSMVNWWFKITTPVGQNAKQIKLLNNNYVSSTSVAGSGLISPDDLTTGIEVTGHSLGGYLATAFTRLFGKQANITHTSTFNSAGFAPGSEVVFTQLHNLIGVNNGLGRYPSTNEQSNYFATNGLNITTNSFYFNQQGQRISLYQEDTFSIDPFNNHYMYKLTDLLALGNLVSKLNSNLNTEKLNTIIKAASNTMKGSYEGVVDALYRILIPNTTPLKISDASDTDPARVAYHSAIKDLQNSATFKALIGKVSINTNAAPANTAKTDFLAFLSLYYLLPFSLASSDSGAISALKASHASLAGLWSADQVARNQGKTPDNFSDKWFEDRTVFRSWL